NGRLDILAANRLGRALYSQALKESPEAPNLARFIFLDEASREFYVDWEQMADACVGSLRAEAGRDPYSDKLMNLVDQLSQASDAFRRRWASHDVHEYRS